MPLYFFHIENGHRITSDEGEEFPDDKSALQEADAIAADLSRNQVRPTGLLGRPSGRSPAGSAARVARLSWRPLLSIDVRDYIGIWREAANSECPLPGRYGG